MKTKTYSIEDRINWTYSDYLKKSLTDLAELAQNDAKKFVKLFHAHYESKLNGGDESTEDRTNWMYADYLYKSQTALLDLATNDEEKFVQLLRSHYALSDANRLKVEHEAMKAIEDRSNWTFADYQENNPKALHDLFENNNAKFEQLFNAHYGKRETV